MLRAYQKYGRLVRWVTSLALRIVQRRSEAGRTVQIHGWWQVVADDRLCESPGAHSPERSACFQITSLHMHAGAERACQSQANGAYFAAPCLSHPS